MLKVKGLVLWVQLVAGTAVDFSLAVLLPPWGSFLPPSPSPARWELL